MALRIGINGFGRVGRAVTRLLQNDPRFELAGINDLAPIDQLAHALKYDSVHGRFPVRVESQDGSFLLGEHQVPASAVKEPAGIPWKHWAVDYVIEATGHFRQRAVLGGHLVAGAAKVILAVPGKEPMDATIVMGINDGTLTGAERLVSNASCTTNAAAPVLKVLHEAFGIRHGYLNTIHAYTNGQSLVDFPNKDWRRSRAAAVSIIPTSTGAAKAIGQVIPSLAGKLDGGAYRVPVVDGSIVDLLLEMDREVTVEAINDAVLASSKGPLRGILEYQTEPIVSVDILGNPHSCIFDSELTQVVDGNMVRVAAWYDNETGYSARLLDLAALLERRA